MSNSILYGFSKSDLEHVVRKVITEIRKTNIVQDSPINPEEDRLTQKEAATFLGVSVTSLISWKKQGKVPYYQIGRSIFFSKAELLKISRKNRDLLNPNNK